MTATIHLREISDVIADALSSVARTAAEKASARLEPAVVSELYTRVQRAVEMAVTAVRDRDAEASGKVSAMSGEIRQLADDLLSRLAEGFDAADPEGPAILRLQTTFVTALRQIFTLARRVARNASPCEAHIAEEK